MTDALLARGIAEERLVLVEYNPEFCTLLAKRYPKATVVQGDAYALEATVSPHLKKQAAAVVSSLPLFTKPEKLRLALLNNAFELMTPGAPSSSSPMRPSRPCRASARISRRMSARASGRTFRRPASGSIAACRPDNQTCTSGARMAALLGQPTRRFQTLRRQEFRLNSREA